MCHLNPLGLRLGILWNYTTYYIHKYCNTFPDLLLVCEVK